ncbi:MAG TPA: hypothetical protein VM778_07435 [Gemmatimonadota bacterium]|nr:hypothetical protein [Gemmatimonadota bacterium]
MERIAPPGESPGALEWTGWGLLGATTLITLLLAVFRPTDPASIVNEIRLAAGFDRWQAGMDEGDRLYRVASAELRWRGDELEPEQRREVHAMLAEAVERYETARESAEGFHEDQQAQIAAGRAYYRWAGDLYQVGTGRWYQRNDELALREARELVDRALALPNLTGSQRVALERLGTSIDRALTPWPIL